MYQPDPNAVPGADQLLDHGTSPLSAGLPPPANTGASLPGPQPNQPPPPGMDQQAMMQGMGGGQAAPPMPPQAPPDPTHATPPEGALNGAGALTAAHGQALRAMVKKLGSMMRK